MGAEERSVAPRGPSLLAFMVAVTLLLAMLIGMRPGIVWAQAQGSEVQRFQQVAGPYEISAAVVQSHLSLGMTLFAITVVDAVTGLPIPDARVLLTTEHDESGDLGRGSAHNTPSFPDRYDSQMRLESSGLWHITIEVESSQGKVAVEMMQLNVPATRRISGGTFVFIGALILIVGGAAYIWWSTQRGRSRDPGTGATPD